MGAQDKRKLYECCRSCGYKRIPLNPVASCEDIQRLCDLEEEYILELNPDLNVKIPNIDPVGCIRKDKEANRKAAKKYYEIKRMQASFNVRKETRKKYGIAI